MNYLILGVSSCLPHNLPKLNWQKCVWERKKALFDLADVDYLKPDVILRCDVWWPHRVRSHLARTRQRGKVKWTVSLVWARGAVFGITLPGRNGLCSGGWCKLTLKYMLSVYRGAIYKVAPYGLSGTLFSWSCANLRGADALLFRVSELQTATGLHATCDVPFFISAMSFKSFWWIFWHIFRFLDKFWVK